MSEEKRAEESDRGTDCLFCRVLNGSVPSKPVEIGDPLLSRELYAFEDINPQAPHHVLIIPRRHIASVNELGAGDSELVGKLFLAAQSIARDREISEKGYRLVVNTNAGAGQSVFHLHAHLLGGRILSWPPG